MELALDLHWAWNHGTDELWALLDPDLWAATHNPWVVLQTMSKAKLEAFLGRPKYRKRVETLLDHGAGTWPRQRGSSRAILRPR